MKTERFNVGEQTISVVFDGFTEQEIAKCKDDFIDMVTREYNEGFTGMSWYPVQEFGFPGFFAKEFKCCKSYILEGSMYMYDCEKVDKDILFFNSEIHILLKKKSYVEKAAVSVDGDFIEDRLGRKLTDFIYVLLKYKEDPSSDILHLKIIEICAEIEVFIRKMISGQKTRFIFESEVLKNLLTRGKNL